MARERPNVDLDCFALAREQSILLNEHAPRWQILHSFPHRSVYSQADFKSKIPSGGRGSLAHEHAEDLRQQEEDLVVEEIRLRERMRARNGRGKHGRGSASSSVVGINMVQGAAAEADLLLLSEVDTRREEISQRWQDLAFEQEFAQINSRVPLVSVLARLITMHDQPSPERSVRSQAQRLLMNLR